MKEINGSIQISVINGAAPAQTAGQITQMKEQFGVADVFRCQKLLHIFAAAVGVADHGKREVRRFLCQSAESVKLVVSGEVIFINRISCQTGKPTPRSGSLLLSLPSFLPFVCTVSWVTEFTRECNDGICVCAL